MPRGLVIVVAVALIVALAVVEGLRSNRWGAGEDLKAAAARLDRVPAEFGDWTSREAPIDPKILKIAEANGSISRVYSNRKTGEGFTVLLLCGPIGPIGAHTPDICYGGLGYKCVGKPAPRRLTVGDGASSFWTARFEKAGPADEPLRIFWAWGVDGSWKASDTPRTEFALRNALYKIYVVRTDAPERANSATTVDAIEGFLKEFIPVVREALAEGVTS
jgi:hypothetical protein